MAISKSEIEDIAELFFHESAEERVEQCGRMTNIMKLELQDNNNISKTPVLQKGVISDGNDSVGHAFITLPASEIKEANSGPVIIDSTIQQFCKENYNNGLVELEVESSIEIPENVGIYTPNDDAYELYEF